MGNTDRVLIRRPGSRPELPRSISGKIIAPTTRRSSFFNWILRHYVPTGHETGDLTRARITLLGGPAASILLASRHLGAGIPASGWPAAALFAKLIGAKVAPLNEKAISETRAPGTYSSRMSESGGFNHNSRRFITLGTEAANAAEGDFFQ